MPDHSRAMHETLSLPLAFAAGAVLAALADTLMPEAYERGGPTVALSTAAGFVLAYVLSLVYGSTAPEHYRDTGTLLR